MEERKWYGMHQRDSRVWLKRMMKHFSLTRKVVAEAAGVNISTVDRWLVPPELISHRKMPVPTRRLLEMAVKAGVFDKETENGG